MFISITEINHKGRVTQSCLLKNCSIKESYVNEAGLNIKYPIRTIVGESIEREPKYTAWKLMLNHSYREDGRVKKKQVYLQTLQYWKMVDSYIDYIKAFQKEPLDTGWSIDNLKIWTIISDNFPEKDITQMIDIVCSKLKQIEDAVVQEFKASEEYKWININNMMRRKIDFGKMKNDMEEKEAYARKKFKQYEQESQQQKNQHQSKFNLNPQNSKFTLSEDEVRLISKYYKAMAVKIHPDKGGSDEDMKILNNLRDKLNQ